MRIISLIIIVIVIFLAALFYLKSTQKALYENINPDTKTDTRIEEARKAVEEINRSSEKLKKELEKISEE